MKLTTLTTLTSRKKSVVQHLNTKNTLDTVHNIIGLSFVYVAALYSSDAKKKLSCKSTIYKYVEMKFAE